VEAAVIGALERIYFPDNSLGKTKTVGLELEFPVVAVDGSAPDEKVLQGLISAIGIQLGAEAIAYDLLGNCIKTQDKSGTVISYEACYGIIEFSFVPYETIGALEKEACSLIGEVQKFLKSKGLQLLPSGINPYQWSCYLRPLNTPYMQMIYGISRTLFPSTGKREAFFHFISCASQVHVDVNQDNVVDTLNLLHGISWAKTLLFANSLDLHKSRDGDCLCMRDTYYRENVLGYNANNVGSPSKRVASVKELLEGELEKSMFHVLRDDEYIFFEPIPLKRFFNLNKVVGLALRGDQPIEREFCPNLEDLAYFRPYNHATLTKRGTVEIRSECQQPFPDLFASAAFHLGLMCNVGPALRLLQQYEPSIPDLDALRIMTTYLGYSIQEKLNFPVADFIHQFLCLSREGLISRGLGEERYLDVLFLRLRERVNPAINLKNALAQGESLTSYFARRAEESIGVSGYV